MKALMFIVLVMALISLVCFLTTVSLALAGFICTMGIMGVAALLFHHYEA